MRPCKRLIRSLVALALAGGASACVSYPVYEPGPAPSTVYYVEEPWGCDPFYGPCAPGYGYSSGYWYGGYYGYPHYGYPYYGYPYHDHPRHDHPRDDGDDHGGADWIHNWPPRDRPADPPHDRPPSHPGSRPGNKPGIVYAPRPPRLIPDDRKVPRDPGPNVQRDPPGRVVPVRRPVDEPSGDTRPLASRPQVSKPPAPEAKEPSKPQRKQPARTRDSRQPD